MICTHKIPKLYRFGNKIRSFYELCTHNIVNFLFFIDLFGICTHK